ncbi:T7SS effector LXG polymorphic toxin, partial [Heyndrickxia coagulans]
KKANKTLEHLYDFDSKAASTLDSLDKDIDTMAKFIRQMESMAGDGSLDIATYNPKQFVTTNAYRSLEGELIQKSGVKPVQTVNGKDFGRYLSVKFHIYKDGAIVMEYWKPGSKHLYYERVNEIPKEAIPGSENPDDPLYMDIWNGIYEGSGKAVGDTIESLESLGKAALDQGTYLSLGKKAADYYNKLKSSPAATLKSTAHKTIDMGKYVGIAVKNAFEREVIHGDAKSRAEFFAYGLTSIGLSVLGDKGISKISTASKVLKTGKLAEKAEKLRVDTGVAPVLQAAGAGTAKIPYNVMDELGIRIQKAIESNWNTTNPRIRLPRTNGRWDGETGNGKWYSNNSDVLEVTGGKPIVFKNNRPDFSPWSKGQLKFKEGQLNGTDNDFKLVYAKLMKVKGFKSLNQAKLWLRKKGLTPHHLDKNTIQLIPTKLHRNVPHIGSASDLRGGY